MIEPMIRDVEPYFPLRITEIESNGVWLRMMGKNWGIYTLSVWRLSEGNKFLFGSLDEEANELLQNLLGLEVIKMETQEKILKVDPVFCLSNGQKIEIFSTDTFEPWVFSVDEDNLPVFVPTPADPKMFYGPV